MDLLEAFITKLSGFDKEEQDEIIHGICYPHGDPSIDVDGKRDEMVLRSALNRLNDEKQLNDQIINIVHMMQGFLNTFNPGNGTIEDCSRNIDFFLKYMTIVAFPIKNLGENLIRFKNEAEKDKKEIEKIFGKE